MQRIIAILLLLVAAFYVLPVNSGIIAKNEIACKCTDGNTDDTDTGNESKKETGKEFITGQPVLLATANFSTLFILSNVPCNTPVHYIVETPPPDKA